MTRLYQAVFFKNPDGSIGQENIFHKYQEKIIKIEADNKKFTSQMEANYERMARENEDIK